MKAIIKLIAVAILAASSARSEVRSVVNPMTRARYDTAFVMPPLTIEKQQGWMWCWAASIATIFKHYGHPVAQATIVQRIKGVVIDQAGWPAEMSAALSSTWIDTRGRRFSVSCQIHDVMSGRSSFTNDDIMNDLVANKPILYCNTSHAMVLVSATYELWPNGMRRIVDAEVLDPAPGVPSPRKLNPFVEGFPFYAARVRIR